MVSIAQFLLFLVVLPACSWGMDPTMRYNAVIAYQSWVPESPSVLFQDATHNSRLIDYLRDEVHRMKIIEVAASNTNRHFVIPLQHLKGLYKTFDLPYSNVKHYFAAFRGDWLSNTATFDGIGSVNGVNQRRLANKLKNEIVSFYPQQYGITLHVP